jgi:hypothetical protein
MATIKEGKLLKRSPQSTLFGGKKMQERVFILRADALLYYLPSDAEGIAAGRSGEASSRCKGMIPIEDVIGVYRAFELPTDSKDMQKMARSLMPSEAPATIFIPVAQRESAERIKGDVRIYDRIYELRDSDAAGAASWVEALRAAVDLPHRAAASAHESASAAKSAVTKARKAQVALEAAQAAEVAKDAIAAADAANVEAIGAEAAAVGEGVETVIGAADEGVAGILAFRDGGDGQAGGLFGRHVLHGMDGDVDAAVQQGLLDLLGEQGLAADLHQAAVLDLVAGGDDLDQHHLLERQVHGGGDGPLHHPGLGQRQGAASGAYTYRGHACSLRQFVA